MNEIEADSLITELQRPELPYCHFTESPTTAYVNALNSSVRVDGYHDALPSNYGSPAEEPTGECSG